MAKAKNKRKSADALNNKKTLVKPKKINPFEIHLNKEKFSILGRKCKHDRGLPGVSRAKAQQKRKATLGQEYREKNKTNKFKDNRIGRGATKYTDELANARFAAEKLSQFKVNRKELFNLNDDEILTHRGQTLAELEQFREPENESSEEEGLDAEFTETAHFGGGGNGEKTDRKAAIEDMIAEAKRKKAEAVKDRDEVFDLTSKLDANYKSLLSVMRKLNKKEENPKPAPDDYDRALREMVFEPRGSVTDKLETEEEIIKKEKERLEKLEQERITRMRCEEVSTEPKPAHRSADALDDGYFVESDNEEEPTLAYDLNGDVNADKVLEDKDKDFDDIESLEIDKIQNFDEEDEDEVDEGEEEEESDEDSLDDLKDSDTENEADESVHYGSSGVVNGGHEAFKDKKNQEAFKEKNFEIDTVQELEEGAGVAKEVGSNDGEEEDESDEDSMDDLKVSDTDIETKEKENNKTPNKSKRKSLPADEGIKRRRIDLEKELPFIYDMPNSYEQLTKLLAQESANFQNVIIERIIKCNHPKLDPGNKDKMVKLFAYLLQYVNDIFSEATKDTIEDGFLKFDRLSPHFYDLVHLNPDRASHCILEVIKEKYDDYRKNRKNLPRLDTIIFFKLISNLFSTSDFRHPIVTPCFIFISHILSRACARNRKDIASGLLLTTIVLEYTNLSKRFLPSAVNYLLGIVFLAVTKRSIETIRIVPPFKSSGSLSALLSLTARFEDDIKIPLMLSSDLVTSVIDDEFKVRALNCCLKLLSEFCEIITDRIELGYLVEPFTGMLERIDFDLYPDFVHESFDKARSSINAIITRPMMRLVPVERKPKALRLMEPKIVRVYDDKRRPKLSKEKEMRAIMLHKVKRETKGAVREIRRDNAFITKMQLKRQLQSDMERKEKVRRIYAEASVQQGELNSLSRSKKKNTF